MKSYHIRVKGGGGSGFETALPLLSVLVCILPCSISAQHFTYDTTDVSSTILVLDLVLTSRHLGDGDELGVFTPNGLCAGSWLIDGFPVGIPAFGDDTLSQNIDGFRENEPYNFRLWDSSEEEEVLLEHVFALQGAVEWHPQGISVVDIAEGNRHYEPTPTLIRHRFICSNVSVWQGEDDWQPPPDLALIAIATPDAVHAGLIVWDANAESSAAWGFGDDPDTENIEGFQPGETFRFFYWDDVRELDRPAEFALIEGDTTFADSSVTVFELTVPEPSSVPFDRNNQPEDVSLMTMFPNPFNVGGTLKFTLRSPNFLRISLFDLAGRELAVLGGGFYDAGEHRVAVNAVGLPTGMYLCRVETASGAGWLKVALTR